MLKLKLKLPKKIIILLGINLLLLMALLICLLLAADIRQALPAQGVASRWAGESRERYTQISCFLSPAAMVDEASLRSFGDTVDDKLLEASLEAEKGGRLWTAGWSGDTLLTVRGDHGSAEARAFGLGGDYFLFHPLRLRYGSYFADSDLMDDRVVLDEELAWKLYGSYDLAGLTVTINDIPYYVAGVISREDDRYDRITDPGEPRIYMSYSRLRDIADTPITCYEIVLPDPISGFGKSVVSESFPLGEDGAVLENSGRFQTGPIADVLFSYNERTLDDKELAYPYWENAARLAENELALLLVLSVLFALFPAGCLIFLIIKELKYVKHKLKKPQQSI